MKLFRYLRKSILFFVFLFTLYFIVTPNPVVGEQGLTLAIAILSFFGFIFFLLPRRLGALWMIGVLVFVSLYVGMQTVYFRAFHQYGQIQLLLSFKSEIGAYTSSIKDLLILSDWKYGLLPLFFIMFYVQFEKIAKIYKIRDLKFSSLLIALFLFFTAIDTFSAFNQQLNETQSTDPLINMSSDYSLYSQGNNPTQFVERFGLLTLVYRDTNSLLFSPYQSSLSPEEELTNLLLQKPSPSSSSMSGVFKGKNLLLIEAESLVNLALDPVLTPTLYMLKTQGIFVDGYNSPLLAGSTSDSEFMANTSLLPAFDGKITFNDYAANEYPQTLAKSFSNEGYLTIAAHNNYGEYYNRSVMLPHLGYTFYDAIGLEAYDNVEDSYVIDHLKWMMYNVGPVLSFWVTFDAHQPYDLNELNPKFMTYYNQVNEVYPNLSEEEKVYLAKTMDLDRGLKQLLIDYKNAHVLDELVIMIYGDHYPKGIFQDITQIQDYCGSLGYTELNCLNTPLIIYNTQLTPQTIQKVSSPLDIAPTIYDLFAIPNDFRLNLGDSIFDPNYQGFGFNVWDVISTDQYSYDPLKNTIVNYSNDDNTVLLSDARTQYYRYQLAKSIVPLNYFSTDAFKNAFINP